jgi:hypothetical protein
VRRSRPERRVGHTAAVASFSRSSAGSTLSTAASSSNYAPRERLLCGSPIVPDVSDRTSQIAIRLHNRIAGGPACPARSSTYRLGRGTFGLPKPSVANDMGKLRARAELPPARPNGFDAAANRELIALYEKRAEADRDRRPARTG